MPRVKQNLNHPCNSRHFNSFSIQTQEEAEAFIHKRKGMALAIIQNTASASKVRFIQGCIGISMWKQGCPAKITQTLSSLGVCQTKPTSRHLIDEMRKGLDQRLQVWKEKIEVRGLLYCSISANKATDNGSINIKL